MAAENSGKAGGAQLPVWARDRPSRRPALSLDAIVSAATRIADAEGLDAVSIRRVASEMGVRPMSLYTYIDRKEDLLDLMLDRVSGEILLGDGLPGGWRDALAALARRTREVMLRHRWMSDRNVRNANVGPNALRHVEESVKAVRELGLNPRATIEVLATVDKFVLGHVIFEIGNLAGLPEEDYVQALLASGEFPELARLAAAAKEATATDGEFERGLAWLLDGIEKGIRALSGAANSRMASDVHASAGPECRRDGAVWMGGIRNAGKQR